MTHLGAETFLAQGQVFQEDTGLQYCLEHETSQKQKLVNLPITNTEIGAGEVELIETSLVAHQPHWLWDRENKTGEQNIPNKKIIESAVHIIKYHIWNNSSVKQGKWSLLCCHYARYTTV